MVEKLECLGACREEILNDRNSVKQQSPYVSVFALLNKAAKPHNDPAEEYW